MSASAGKRKRPAHDMDDDDQSNFDRGSSRVASDDMDSDNDNDNISDLDDESSDGASDETGSVIVLDLSEESSGARPDTVSQETGHNPCDRDVGAFCCLECKVWRVKIAGRLRCPRNDSYDGLQCIVCRLKRALEGYYKSHTLNADEAQSKLEEKAAKYIDEWVDTLESRKEDFKVIDIEDLLLVAIQWIPCYLASKQRKHILAAMRREMSPRTFEKNRRRGLSQAQTSDDAACCRQARPASFKCGSCETIKDPTLALYRCGCLMRSKHYAYGTQCLLCRAKSHVRRTATYGKGADAAARKQRASVRMSKYISNWEAEVNRHGHTMSTAEIQSIRDNIESLVQSRELT